MNQKVLAIASVVAVVALALTAVGFSIPQLVFAGSYGYHHHHDHHHKNNNHRNNLRVDQQVNQQNSCTGGQWGGEALQPTAVLGNGSSPDIASNGFPNGEDMVSGSSFYINAGDNSASVHRWTGSVATINQPPIFLNKNWARVWKNTN